MADKSKSIIANFIIIITKYEIYKSSGQIKKWN